MKDEDYDGIRSMYNEDAMYYSDKMRPGIGIEGKIHVLLFALLKITQEPIIITNDNYILVLTI